MIGAHCLQAMILRPGRNNQILATFLILFLNIMFNFNVVFKVA
jgi:hypothetical protein